MNKSLDHLENKLSQQQTHMCIRLILTVSAFVIALTNGQSMDVDNVKAPVSDMLEGLAGKQGSYHDISSYLGDIPSGSFDFLQILNKIVEYKQEGWVMKYLQRYNLIKDMMKNGETTFLFDREQLRDFQLNKHAPAQLQHDHLDNVFVECDKNGDGQLSYQELKDCFSIGPLNDYESSE
eukprot:542100_1